MSATPHHPSARERLAAEPALSLTVPAVAEHVSRVRRAVDAVAERAGFDRTRRADVALAVSEACANAVVHAYGDGSDPGRLHVRADVVDGALHVVVEDEGSGMAPRPDSPGLGLGLPLMASLTSVLELHEGEDGGTAILMVFEASPGSAGASWAHTG